MPIRELKLNLRPGRQNILRALLWASLLFPVCVPSVCGAQSGSGQHPASSPKAQTKDAGLSVNFERRTGDLDAMLKARNIRALVLYSHSSFFYVNGKPEGIFFEALRDFEQFVNEKLHTGRNHVQVTFIPVRPDQLEAYLNEGIGDLIAYPITVTAER